MLSAAVRSARAVATTGHGFQSVALTSVGSLRFKSVLPNDVDFNLIDREAPHPVDPLAKNLKPVKFPKFDKQLGKFLNSSALTCLLCVLFSIYLFISMQTF